MLIQKCPNLFRRSSGQKLFGVAARGRWFIAANEDVGGCWHWSGHQRPNTGGHTLGAETLCIVVKRAGRCLSGDALAVEMVEIHRFLVVTWTRATQQRQAQAKSPLSVQIRRKWPEIEKLQ